MIDKRLNLITTWLNEVFNSNNLTISKVSDDASFRRYFRVKYDNNTFVIMDAPPLQENCDAFIKIDKCLINIGVHAPKIITSNLQNGFLLLEDLGDLTFLQAQQKSLDIELYKVAIDTLVKIQSIDANLITIPKYDKTLLNNEMQLLIDWYLPKKPTSKQKNTLQKVFNLLTKNALNTKQVFVHRDYHSRNLMNLKNDLGVIDFQDAVIGANTYDLVSLLKDAYFELEQANLSDLLNYYYQHAKITTPFIQFSKQFDLMGLQRHLKILGIFKRLSKRDNKHQYLKNIPLVKKYALQVAGKYPELSVLKEFL